MLLIKCVENFWHFHQATLGSCLQISQLLRQKIAPKTRARCIFLLIHANVCIYVLVCVNDAEISNWLIRFMYINQMCYSYKQKVENYTKVPLSDFPPFYPTAAWNRTKNKCCNLFQVKWNIYLFSFAPNDLLFITFLICLSRFMHVRVRVCVYVLPFSACVLGRCQIFAVFFIYDLVCFAWKLRSLQQQIVTLFLDNIGRIFC